MNDDLRLLDRSLASHLAALGSRPPERQGREAEADEEESCPAFGFLRGLNARALTVELRLRDGNKEYFPYSWLGPWRHNPSVGLLLKFTGEVTSLVLIRGSNLAALVGNQSVNLTDRGIARHRITWVREMDEDELRRVGKGEPTIDRIEIAEFETHDELTQWLRKHGPAFVRQERSP